MAQSLTKNYLHIIFSTKHRQPFIDEAIENDLHSYLAGICNNLECFTVKVGGYWDHIHILCLLCKKITLIKLIEHVKADSSYWIKTKGHCYQDFYWQAGYGAFSVSPSEVETVKRYIENQHEHHKNEDFQDEYRGILKTNEIEFDERYVWEHSSSRGRWNRKTKVNILYRLKRPALKGRNTPARGEAAKAAEPREPRPRVHVICIVSGRHSLLAP